jgi:hypothetical protein
MTEFRLRTPVTLEAGKTYTLVVGFNNHVLIKETHGKVIYEETS